MKRILICGSRTYGVCQHPPRLHDPAVCPNASAEANAFIRAMDAWIAKHGRPTLVIEGEARGADTMAAHWARTLGIEVAAFPANWDDHGRAAGPIRNKQMLDEGRPDAVIAFSTDLANSRGTANMVRQARAAGVPVWTPIKQGA